MDLRNYQLEALAAVNEYESKGIRKQLIVLPTGTGKTVIFAHIPKFRPDSLPMLVLAHREELLVQAKDKIERANPELRVAIEQGSNYAGRPDVVIASVATIGRANTKRLSDFGSDYFRTVIVDEAHHAAAPSYKRVLEYFDKALHVGFTATPQRGDHTRLTDVFDEIVYFKTIREMIDAGFLANLRGFRLLSNTDISGVSSRAGDFNEAELSLAVNGRDRNDLIVSGYRDIVPSARTLVFCVDVKHAHAVAEAFKRAGIGAACITGNTPTEERRAILQLFHSGDDDVRVICNCQVLTEGFDEPSIEAIILARPTRSIGLYTQIVGRGTRIYPGKPWCTIIDVADTSRSMVPIGLPTLMGLPADFDLGGQTITEGQDELEALLAKSPSAAASVKSLKDIDLAWEKIDIFTPPPPDPALLEYSTFIWAQSSPGNYVLGLDLGESLLLREDTLGRTNVSLHANGTRNLIGLGEGLREGFALADNWIRNNRVDKVVLLDVNAPWRHDPPTEKQIKWLKKNGVPYEHLSKGEASIILDKLFAASPKQPRPAWLQRKIDNNRYTKGF